MLKQVLFILSLGITLLAFAYTTRRFVRFFKLTKPAFRVGQFGRRFGLMLEVAFGQTRIFRRPVMGLLHALVFWGFCVILIGSVEMVYDGISGSEKAFKFLGIVYDIIWHQVIFLHLSLLLPLLFFLPGGFS